MKLQKLLLLSSLITVLNAGFVQDRMNDWEYEKKKKSWSWKDTDQEKANKYNQKKIDEIERQNQREERENNNYSEEIEEKNEIYLSNSHKQKFNKISNYTIIDDGEKAIFNLKGKRYIVELYTIENIDNTVSTHEIECYKKEKRGYNWYLSDCQVNPIYQ